MNPRIRRAGLAAALTVLTAVGISSPAWAGTKAQGASGSQKLTTGSWGAVGTSTGGSPATGSAYTLTWQGLGGSTVQYFEIDNTGTFDLSGETYTTTNSPLKLIGTTAPAVTLTGCVGADWNHNNNTCAGTTVVLDTSASGSTTAAAAIATADSLSVQAKTTTSLFGWTTSVAVSTTRSQIRSATTTNN